MKASYGWITSYLPDYGGSPEDLEQRLTFSGTEVEEVVRVGDDHVLDCSVTSNRTDCLCHVGLARELAVLTGCSLVEPDRSVKERGGPVEGGCDLVVEDPLGCPLYTGRIIEGVRVGPSPDWLAGRLEAVGVTPVNNVVDVTNFVLLELNQPLHAFDLARLGGPAVRVRRAVPGERLKALNEREYELSGEDLVIADARRPVALAGVMGGKDTEVGAATTDLLLESAWFDPVTVRRSSRRHKLETDSSFRFERGIDRAGVVGASARAAALIVEICGGSVRQGLLQAGDAGPAPGPVALRPSRVGRVSGVEVPLEATRSVLERLACSVDVEGPDVLSVRPPSFRGDLGREIDLVEEVIRVRGFEEVPDRTSMKACIATDDERWSFRGRVQDRMAALGLMEVMTPNFVSEELPAGVTLLGAGEGLVALAPVRAGEGALRRSLLPSLLQVRKHNFDAGNDDLAFFEVSNLHFAAEDGAPPGHLPALGFLLDGDLRDGRGVVEGLLGHLGVEALVEPWDPPEHLDASGAARITSDGRVLGILGRPSWALVKWYGLKRQPVFGELDLAALRGLAPATKRLGGLARFPAVTRDLSLFVREGVAYADLVAAVRAAVTAHLESVTLEGDVYRGRHVPDGQKNLVLRLTFRSQERTLTSDEVGAEVERAVAAVRDRCGASLSGT